MRHRNHFWTVKKIPLLYSPWIRRKSTDCRPVKLKSVPSPVNDGAIPATQSAASLEKTRYLNGQYQKESGLYRQWLRLQDYQQVASRKQLNEMMDLISRLGEQAEQPFSMAKKYIIHGLRFANWEYLTFPISVDFCPLDDPARSDDERLLCGIQKIYEFSDQGSAWSFMQNMLQFGIKYRHNPRISCFNLRVKIILNTFSTECKLKYLSEADVVLAYYAEALYADPHYCDQDILGKFTEVVSRQVNLQSEQKLGSSDFTNLVEIGLLMKASKMTKKIFEEYWDIPETFKSLESSKV
ncbi:uncharacterized protein V1516DRAFT_686486 [Lipomyces oligophaga]|uniref:uncharacterized protein n=1 Tax=Lipomyces oligophaga TaxID=45792 RepID=UPI0034CEAEA3